MTIPNSVELYYVYLLRTIDNLEIKLDSLQYGFILIFMDIVCWVLFLGIITYVSDETSESNEGRFGKFTPKIFNTMLVVIVSLVIFTPCYMLYSDIQEQRNLYKSSLTLCTILKEQTERQYPEIKTKSYEISGTGDIYGIKEINMGKEGRITIKTKNGTIIIIGKNKKVG